MEKNTIFFPLPSLGFHKFQILQLQIDSLIVMLSHGFGGGGGKVGITPPSVVQ